VNDWGGALLAALCHGEGGMLASVFSASTNDHQLAMNRQLASLRHTFVRQAQKGNAEMTIIGLALELMLGSPTAEMSHSDGKFSFYPQSPLNNFERKLAKRRQPMTGYCQQWSYLT